VPEKDIGIICERLHRVTEIQRVLVQQLTVLETMSPMGFLTFRDVLFPASGFQSVQWRIMENRLGLPASVRLKYGKRDYKTFLKPEDAAKVVLSEEAPSLLFLVDKWLARAPMVRAFGAPHAKTATSPKAATSEEEPSTAAASPASGSTEAEASDKTHGRFDFWVHYREGLKHMFSEDERHIQSDAAIDEPTKAELLAELGKQQDHFKQLFDPAAYEELRERGDRRLSYDAFKAALLIQLHHDAPVLQQPMRLLSLLVDIDELSALWRQRHAIMVHRMLGAKMGTGGSSGYHYLRSAASRHKVFTDLFDLSTFLVPKQALPPLPKEVNRGLVFALETGHRDEDTEGPGGAETTAVAAAGGGGED